MIMPNEENESSSSCTLNSLAWFIQRDNSDFGVFHESERPRVRKLILIPMNPKIININQYLGQFI